MVFNAKQMLNATCFIDTQAGGPYKIVPDIYQCHLYIQQTQMLL